VRKEDHIAAWKRLWPVLLSLLLAACGAPSRAPAPFHHATHRAHQTRLTGTWYRVKKGDTLWAVSWRAGVDYRTLARWNRLKPPYTIFAGQLLRLRPPPPPKRTASSTAKGQSSTARRGTASTKKRSRTTARHSKQTGRKLHWRWPIHGTVISRFSYSDPDRDGIKIAGARGQKVLAAESGTVVYSGSGLIGYGQLIIIKHNNEFLSAYGHNSRLLVKEGEKVKRGQHISDLGVDSAGKALLHFEIRRYGKPVDPLIYLPRG